jgi:hypothetical protein
MTFDTQPHFGMEDRLFFATWLAGKAPDALSARLENIE